MISLKRINVLSLDTANKIAAGEVVERPSSVVKELIENSIDAEAKNITIEILDGGQNLIKIIDDGVGIHPDDIEKAFQPHATSKITDSQDIFNITTLGFRGEALPSIAAVSNILLKSRTADFQHGKEISFSGGFLNHISEAGLNVGTLIEVKDLFFNVPARLKFLKSSVREAALINDIVSRISLANPNVSIKLLNNEKKVIQTFGNGKITDCIRSIYGRTVCEELTYFEKHTDVASVYGYIGSAELSRGSRNNQTIFVNKRFIKSKLITAAVENAFKSFITINKFPFFILFLDIFPEFVDVNIHPTKSEIKFRDDREIFKLVFDAVHQAIRASLKDSFDITEQSVTFDTEKDSFETISYFEDKNQNMKSSEPNTIDLPVDLKSLGSTINESGTAYEKKWDVGNNSSNKSNDDSNINKNRYNAFSVDGLNSDTAELNSSTSITLPGKEVIYTAERTPKLPKLEIIGQFQKTYILAQAVDDLYIIDQHAAHEKIIFEKYIRSISNADTAVQMLLTPVVLELGLEDYAVYEENTEVFANAGFSIDFFGDNTITVREIPYILGALDIKGFILGILDNLKNMGSGKTTEVKYNSIAKLACKAAIKANHSLSDMELKALLDELRFADDPFNCPHGRPTIIKFSQYELEKKFKRVM